MGEIKKLASENDVSTDSPGKDMVNRILNAAEKVFADKGYEGTSLRTIIEEAQVANGAIHYHFRTKEELFHRVIGRRGEVIAAERIKQLEGCRQAEGRPQLLEQIIFAYISPLVSPVLGSQEIRLRFARLKARVITDYDWINPDPLGKHQSNTDQRFLDTIVGDQSHLTREEARMRFLIMWSSINTMSAGLSRAALHESTRKVNVHPLIEFEKMIPRMVGIFAEMFRAPDNESDGFSSFLERMRGGSPTT